MRSGTDYLISIAVGLGATGALTAIRAASRRHTIADGTDGRGQVLNVESIQEGGILNQRFFLVQLAIPKPDGTEIVAVARVPWRSADTMPEPGWTVPVHYRERLGTTTRAEITGPYTRVSRGDPPA